MAASRVFRNLMLLICLSIYSVSSSPQPAPQGVQAVEPQQQTAVAPASADPATATRRCPRCRKHFKKVCADDGRTYRNECHAICANARLMHNGKCHCSIRPAATCQAIGQDCLLNEQQRTFGAAACSCCNGLICWAGPVVRQGQVLGRCFNASGPLPIG